MKVAVVSAYNNQVELTREFLDRMQWFWPAEIEPHLILVNGGGPEAIEHPFISRRIDLPTNEGFCPTLNAGLAAVPPDSDYVFFVGNDSFPLEGEWLPRLVALQVRTGAWMACPAHDKMHRNADLLTSDCGDHWEVERFPSIAWLMPYARFAAIGLLDQRFLRTGMYADYDYCQRIRTAGGKIVVSKSIVLRHLISAEGRVLGTQGWDMRVNRRRYNRKWPESPVG